VSTERLPARRLPLLYIGTAHVSLGVACLVAAWWPQSIAGFFYHAWLLGIVHLITLGWISFSILGAIYLVGPLALQMAMPVRRADYVAYTLGVVGLIGMVCHFWLQESAGMALAAATVAAGILYMTARIAARVQRAKVQPAVKLHVVLACANFWIAATMGVLIAFDKAWPFLPGFVLAHVFAHAHLAAIGWVTMMVVGVAYRLLPMIVPSKIASGRSMYASAVLLEAGVLGLFVTLLVGSRLAAVFGLMIVAGLIAFGTRVAWMLGHRVPRPAAAPQPDFGLLHAAAAGVWLVFASGLGIYLLFSGTTETTLRAAAAYGVFGLVGFLAQMVTAMEARLIPMVAWLWSYAGSGYRVVPLSPHLMRDRALQTLVFAGWTIGVPLLAAGMFWESAMLIRIGAWALFIGVGVGAIDTAFVVVPAVQRTTIRREVA
jgi:hypothetical protein